MSSANNNNKTSIKKETHIPLSKTRSEYERLGIKYEISLDDYQRENFIKTTKGVYTRKIPQITRIRFADGTEYLDWVELRTGKSAMGRVLTETFNHVSRYFVPVPYEELELNAETEEYELVKKGEKEQLPAYQVLYSESALNELFQDIIPYMTQYQILQEHGKPYTVSKQEISNKDFEKLYNKKAGLSEINAIVNN